jgi:DNA-binding beta-propeller fold protein YncE
MKPPAESNSKQAIQVGQGAFRYTVDQAWPTLPGNGQYGEAVAVACDSRDRVYLFARGPHPVLVYGTDGSLLQSWGEEEFVRPHGIFVGPDDTVYCTDDCDHTIRAFTVDGEPKFKIGTSGGASDTGATSMDYRTIKHSGPPFHYPTNLALSPAGDMYIADGYGNARVHCFSPEGKLRHSWGEPGDGPGQFHVPHGIAVSKDSTVYVADRENSRIQLFTAVGVFLGQWTDVARPCQLYIDREGWIYVAELGFRAGRWPGTGEAPRGASGGRVSIFDPKGALQARWGGGESPTAPGDFFAPHGIWIDSRGDIYVTEVVLSAGGRAGLVPTSCHSCQKFTRVRP